MFNIVYQNLIVLKMQKFYCIIYKIIFYEIAKTCSGKAREKTKRFKKLF